MPSIHPDFEYDIFISYRQNDNRSDKWVSNFVEALKEELEATLKNPISIYFDENPHDGLLETHQVDASLAKKLKCLVFMPIISQTYCDESSFAWEHEFMSFIKTAKGDEMGMNITLSNGNVVSRVLPVKIHRLDSDDQNTLEAVLDGPLRSIDFIYQEVGVNRPLKSDDDRNLNLEKTDYQNQVNKVANALKDIGLSLLKQSDGKISIPIPERERPVDVAKSSHKGVYIGLATIIIAFLAYWGYKQFYNSPLTEAEDVAIAVLAFDDQSPDGDQEWLGDGMADEILNVLAKVNGLQVTGKTSSFSFKGKGATIQEIGEALNVQTVLEGSVSKMGDKIRITAQLIDVETDKHIWSKKYDRDTTGVFAIIDEVSQSIATSLLSELSIEELDDITVGHETDPEAYEYYLKGVHIHTKKYLHGHNDEDFKQSEKMFAKAIAIDSIYANAYAALADLYDSKSNNDGYLNSEYDGKRDSVVAIAYRINPNSADVLLTKGLKFRRTNSNNIDSAFYYHRKAFIKDPENIWILGAVAWLYVDIGLYENSILISKKLLKSDPLNIETMQRLYIASMNIGDRKSAKQYLINILDIDRNNLFALGEIFRLALIYDHEIDEARKTFQILEQLAPGKNEYQNAMLLAGEGRKEEALSLNKKSMVLYSILDMKKEGLIFARQILARSLTPEGEYVWVWEYLHLQNIKIFDFIIEEPGFQEILTRAKKVHEERVAKYGHLFDE